MSGLCQRAGLLVLVLLLAGASSAPGSDGVFRNGEMRSKFELFVWDEIESAAFYEVLGFEVVERKETGYTTVRQDSVIIALSPVPGWLPLHWLGFLRHPPLGTEIVLYVDALEPRRKALKAAGYDPGEIQPRPWGHRDFRVTDPDGYYVRITLGEPFGIAAAHSP